MYLSALYSELEINDLCLYIEGNTTGQITYCTFNLYFTCSYIRFIILKHRLYKSRNSYTIQKEKICPSVRICLENCIFRLFTQQTITHVLNQNIFLDKSYENFICDILLSRSTSRHAALEGGEAVN